MEVELEYYGGIDQQLDKQLDALATKWGVSRIGSGCFLMGGGCRDIQYGNFEDEGDAAAFESEAKKMIRGRQN